MTERGQLRVYLGAAPGVGKTYAMIDEGHRRAARGTDVVIAYAETHGRSRTEAKLAGLEVIPRRTVTYRGSQFTEMDLPAVFARAPQVALVDELAHTNVPGVEHAKRWQDIEQLLEAGITVISNVNIQHLESLNDVVQEITGVVQRETVPDSVVRAAEQVELVDMTAEALRRRMAHGNVYQPDRIDAALSNYFRPGNLTALRELALLWLADAVEDNLQRYREEHGIARKWETRERVVVALTGGPEGEALLRRAARIAARVGGGELLAVHVARSDGLAGSSVAELDNQRALVESLGGSYHSVVGDSIPAAVLEFARANNASQIVIGASRRNPTIAALTGPGTGMTITRQSGPIDVHVVSHDYMGRGRVLRKLSSGLTRKRRLAALITAAVLLSALVPICAALRDDLGFGTDLLLFLLAVIIVSLVGGFITAVATAIAASLLLNYYFVPPIHELTISQPANIFALVVFVVVALLVAKVVDVAARHSSEAARSNAEAETMSTLAGSLLRGEQAIPAMLERVRESFGAQDAALLRRESGAPASRGGESAGMRGTWSCVASVGDNPCLRPEDANTEVPVGDDMVLALRGRVLAAEDQRVLAAFATQVAVAYEQRRLTEVAEAAIPLAEADRVRTALLNAVSHDLRTPLASAKAAVSSLRSPDVAWSEQDREEFLTNADEALDRLTALVTNLLDLSRLQVGVLAVETDPVAVEDVVSHALNHSAPDNKVELDIPSELPAVAADSGLLERAVANLVENALRYSPPGELVRIAASAHRDTIQVQIIDHGPGIPPADREAVFAPFQRRDDHSSAGGQGVGLGLAIARGFVEAMHGTITLDDTPGGGLIATIELPIARPH
jgi:two-component system sensor histidine kinase KdpD